MSDHIPLIQSIALVGLTAGVLTAFFRAALARRAEQVASLEHELALLRRKSSEELRTRLELADKRVVEGEQMFSEVANLLSILCARFETGDLTGVLNQDGKMLLREFLFYKAKRDLAETGSSSETTILARHVIALLDSFEYLAESPITVEDYLPRMRSLSDTFFAWLPEILDQGKVIQHLGPIASEGASQQGGLVESPGGNADVKSSEKRWPAN